MWLVTRCWAGPFETLKWSACRPQGSTSGPPGRLLCVREEVRERVRQALT
jgi:hypothetical protein